MTTPAYMSRPVATLFPADHPAIAFGAKSIRAIEEGSWYAKRGRLSDADRHDGIARRLSRDAASAAAARLWDLGL